MKDKISNIISKAINELISQGKLKAASIPKIEISIPGNRSFGDYSSNIAMQLTKQEKSSPRDLAEMISAQIKTAGKGIIKDSRSAGPGFINLSINEAFLQNDLEDIRKLDKRFGVSRSGKGKNILIEFVSANPTGPLHVGHGRWAVLGDAIARLLESIGSNVKREYYVNDVGTQIDLLIDSVKARLGEKPAPEGGYGGAYITDIAERVKDKVKEKNFKEIVLKLILDEQKNVLETLGVKYDSWVKESKFHKAGKINDIIKDFEQKKVAYREKGALWFKSEAFGDDKNRVLVREDGAPTYFAADIAYHKDKFKRGFDSIINIWGTDHHGYVARLKAAMKALSLQDEKLEIILGQLVTLFRGKEPVRMSKRTGEIITLEEVIDEIGGDEARFFFVMLSPDTHLDFDLELAKKKSHENPVYYVQYAHARICSILREAEKRVDEDYVNLLRTLTG